MTTSPRWRDDAMCASLAGLHVLVLEDHRELRKLFALMLTRDGADVVPVATAREALTACVGRTFDAVLTDLGLPDAPGETLIRELAATGRPRPLIIVISADDHPRLARAEAAGADVLLQKPVDWSRVAGHLRALRTLRQRRPA